MALNDNSKLPTLEPVQYDEKSRVAGFLSFLSVAVWGLGLVLTVFVALGFAEIGTFRDLLPENFEPVYSIAGIVCLALGVFFLGLVLLVTAAVLKLLKRKATTVYVIRNLDNLTVRGADPRTGAKGLKGSQEGASDASSTRSRKDGSALTIPVKGDQSGVQITLNLNTPNVVGPGLSGAPSQPLTVPGIAVEAPQEPVAELEDKKD